MPLKHIPMSQHCCVWRIGRRILTPGIVACLCWFPLQGLQNDVRAAPQQSVQDTTGTTVVDVRIEGNETIPESVILQKIQTQPNRAVSERQIREDKRSLMSTRWFFSVTERLEETPQGRVLIFKVHERPIVQRVVFVGNKKVKTKYLEGWTGLKAGSPYDHVANKEAVHRIEQEYKEKGHYFVRVTLEKGGTPGDREVIFRIHEGPRVRVQHRTFQGNKFWGNGDLKKNLASKEAILGEIPGFDGFGGLYRPETVNLDVEALKQFYRGVGFFDVDVRAEPRFSPDRASVNLHYTISEGVRFKVRDIRYQGNEIIQNGQLKSDSKLNPGDYFSSHPLGKDVQRMLKYYGDLGHYFASVNPVPHFTETPGIVDLVFEIDEDRPRYIRKVSVSYDGDYPHTKQTVVLDRMQVAPGDLANPAMIRRSRSRLNGSGLFEPGLQFDVSPVDPEQISFASSTRTFRGQGPDTVQSAADAWTNRFAEYTHQAARMSVIGDAPWDYDSAAENDDFEWNHASQSVPAPRTSEKNQSGTITPDIDRTNRRSELQPTNSRIHTEEPHSSVQGGHSGILIGTEAPGATETSVAAVGRSASPVSGEQGAAPVSGAYRMASGNTPSSAVQSWFTAFRSASPQQLFSVDAAEFLTSSQQLEEEPVIRGQSPGPFYNSTPAPTDPVLEGSPYRNQFQTVPPGWVDINVRAAEGRTGRLMAGAGVNSDAGLVGSFVWDESNFDLFRPPQTFADVIEGRAWRGGGQRFRLEAAPGSQVSRYAISWTDPYFLYTDYSFSVSGFYFNRFYPDWDEDRLGGRISLGRQLTPEWSINAALRLEDVQLKNPRTPTPPIVARDVGSSFLSTIRASATHDTRDMAIMPGEGHYLDLAYEQAFYDFTYPRVEGEFRQYFTTYNRPDGSGRQVLTLAGNIGWSGDDTPVFERYYAGGFQSFRGFSFRGVTPRTGGVATGGTWQLLGTVEYRVPVTADDMINIVAFSDFGTVEDEVSVSQFRMTAGLGLRVVVPAMGPVPLAFDFAFPVAAEEFDDERIFSFYVGINR